MPIWAVTYFADEYLPLPHRRAIIKAENENAAIELIKQWMENDVRAEFARSIVKDESKFYDGYVELES